MRCLSRWWMGLGLISSLAGGEPTWIRLELPDFTVISATGESAARNWAVRFEQFHQGMKQVLTLPDRVLRPVTVVLFRSQRDFDPYKPLEKGRPAQLAGFFSGTPLANYIGLASAAENLPTQRLIFHEGVHWLTHATGQPIPLWLDEGLAEVFSTFQVRGNTYSYGDLLPGHVLLLRHSRYIPLRQLLSIPPGALLFNEGDRTGIFYAESWAFVHYLLFSGHRELAPQYNLLVDRLHSGQDPDAVFQALFGCTCDQMQARLQRYIAAGVYQHLVLPFDRSAIEARITLRAATPAEVSLAQASLLLGTGRAAAALPILTRCAAELPHRLEATEAVAMADYELERFGEAQRWFQQAADRHSPHPFVYAFLADEALGCVPGDHRARRRPDAKALRVATDYYLQDLALNPGDEHAYENIAKAMAGLDAVQPAEVQMLRVGAVLFPQDQTIQTGLTIAGIKRSLSGRAPARD